jgi:hypothetical protein
MHARIAARRLQRRLRTSSESATLCRKWLEGALQSPREMPASTVLMLSGCAAASVGMKRMSVKVTLRRRLPPSTCACRSRSTLYLSMLHVLQITQHGEHRPSLPQHAW